MFSCRSNQKGTLLFMSIVILTSILAAALGAASLVLSGVIISGTQQRSTQAYFAADAGIEEALWWARKSDTAEADLAEDVSSVVSGTLSNNASYNVDYTTWRFLRNFASTGTFGNTRRKVEAQYGFIQSQNIVSECSAERVNLCDNETDCENAGGTWTGAQCVE